MNETTMYCAFSLASPDLDEPDEVTRRLGLEPTRTWRKGDKMSLLTLPREKDTGWEIAVPEVACIDVNVPLRQLLSILTPVAKKIAGVRTDLDLEAEVSCVLFVRGGSPILHFDVTAVQLIASLGAEIDIDIVYWIGPDEPTE